MSQSLPRLHADPSRRHARRWLRRTVRLIGPGFHLDTKGFHYLKAAGIPLLTPRGARLFDYDLRRVREVLGSKQSERTALCEAWRAIGARFDPGSNSLVRA
jgi:hypothetical protein